MIDLSIIELIEEERNNFQPKQPDIFQGFQVVRRETDTVSVIIGISTQMLSGKTVILSERSII